MVLDGGMMVAVIGVLVTIRVEKLYTSVLQMSQKISVFYLLRVSSIDQQSR